MLAPFAAAGADSASVLVSWLGHVLAVVAVLLIAWKSSSRGSGHQPAFPVAVCLPVFAVALDPLLLFVSRRIWIDSLLSGLVALSLALLWIADGPRRRAVLAVAGLLLGLAALAKLTALVVVPVFVLMCSRSDEPVKDRALSLAAVFLPAALLLAPWLFWFRAQTGVWLPSWVKPDARLMEMYPFVRAAVERPWHYYVTKLALVMPVLIVSAAALLRRPSLFRDVHVRAAVLWVGLVVGVLTALGIAGYGFQMRHIAPGVTAIYVLLMAVLSQNDDPSLTLTATVAALIGSMTGAMHLIAPQFDEIVSLARFAGLDY